MTLDNLAIDIVCLAVNVWLQVLLVIEMKWPFAGLKYRAYSELRGRHPGQAFVTFIARTQVAIDRQQFIRVQRALVVRCKLCL